MRSLPLLLGLVACSGPETQVRNLVPVAAVAPQSLDFGEVAVPLSGVEELYITNSGKAELEFEIVIDGGEGTFTVDVAEGTLAPDETQTVLVDFAPRTFQVYEASLVVSSNDDESPQIAVPLVGEGVDQPMPDIAITPSQTLDFGDVDVGSSKTQFFEIENVGDADLVIGTIVQEGAGVFSLATDPSNNVVAPGGSIPVLVDFLPVQDAGDSGTLRIPSDDPDEPELEVVLLGNGGGDFEYPEAIIDCPGTSAPPEWVRFDGSASNDPSGQPLAEYVWTVVQRPDGSDPDGDIVPTADPAVVDLFTDVGGLWTVQLQVFSDLGVPSVPAKCVLDAVPPDDLHVELSWDTAAADLDLHLVEDGSVLFEMPGDANYCNPSPDWGAAGSDDDPRLDIDDRGGWGPENINVLTPADGDYHVKVHYFEDYGDNAVTATVKIWTFGTLFGTYNKVLTRNEVWDVGTVHIPDGTFAEDFTAPAAAATRTCF